jgi:hypothetical protein
MSALTSTAIAHPYATLSSLLALYLSLSTTVMPLFGKNQMPVEGRVRLPPSGLFSRHTVLIHE